MHDVSEKELLLTCKWCGRQTKTTYKTRQPKFCSEACKQRYKRYGQKQQEKNEAVAEQIVENVIRDWLEAGLSPIIYDLIEVAKRDGVDAALTAAEIAAIAIEQTVENYKTTHLSPQEIDNIVADVRDYITRSLCSSSLRTG